MANIFLILVATPGDGIGASLDVSGLQREKTVIVTGAFDGLLFIEGSTDGTEFSPLTRINGVGTVAKSLEVAASIQFLRARRTESAGVGTPIIGVGGPDFAAAAAAVSNCLIHRPGSGLTGPVVFASWTALHTQLAILRAASNGGGCYQIQEDTSLTGFTTTLPVGAYDMTDVEWVGTDQGIVGFGFSVSIVVVPEGVTFTGLRKISGNLVIDNAATATPPNTDLVDGDTISLRGAANVSSTGGGPPFWSAPGLGAGDSVFVFLYGSSLSGFGALGPGLVLFLPVAGTALECNVISGQIRIDTVGGIVGTTWANTIGIDAEVDATQVAFLGTRTDTRPTNVVGYVLTFGADMNMAGRHAQVHGTGSNVDVVALNAITESLVPRPGTIRDAAINTISADATTVFNVLLNGIVDTAITMPGASSVVRISIDVVAGDEIAIEYDAGTAPDETTINLYVEV